ncbi:MAG: hypothetical protein EA411_03900 [Saprospirales bacterium]|nr:MAG: hypothetical protein EA411_03900 [Saprospirales bacterium]
MLEHTIPVIFYSFKAHFLKVCSWIHSPYIRMRNAPGSTRFNSFWSGLIIQIFCFRRAIN